MGGVGGTVGLWIGNKATEEWELSLGEWVNLLDHIGGKQSEEHRGLKKKLDKWRKVKVPNCEVP